MERMSSPLGEVGAKAVPSDIFHLVFVGERRHSALGIFARKLFIEKDEVGETPADFRNRFGEGFEVGLQRSDQPSVP